MAKAQSQSPEQEYFFLAHLARVKANSGSYLNQGFIGRGGNGTTFRVTSIDGPYRGIQFALKVLHRISDKSRHRAFATEIAHLKALQHPTIVRVYDDGVYLANKKDHPFVVMEYVPETLRHLMAANAVSRLTAMRLAMHCLSALNYMHTRDHPVVHRDIKPENILLSDGLARLSDFGLAKELDPIHGQSAALDDSPHLEVSQWPGMPARYRTPELVKRAKDKRLAVTTASDIYQVGTVFYEMLTGYNPQKPTQEITNPISLDIRPIPGHGGAILRDLVLDMLMDKPDKRPTASVCLERLATIHEAHCRELSKIEGQQV